jgi:hypothetical protein
MLGVAARRERKADGLAKGYQSNVDPKLLRGLYTGVQRLL